MASLIKRLFYKVLSALEFRSDRNYYFLGHELKVDYLKIPDFFLKRLLRKSLDGKAAFSRLVEFAMGYSADDFDLFKFHMSVASFLPGVPACAADYVLAKAFRRGQSLNECRRLKARLLGLPDPVQPERYPNRKCHGMFDLTV